MILLSRPRRPLRAHEWTRGKAVTFIVTLAATHSVTLAAKAAGMSRKSAYALKSRDPAFAHSWNAALEAAKRNKVEEVQASPIPSSQGDRPIRAAPSNESISARRRADAELRDRFLARLAANRSGLGSAAEGLSPPGEPLSLPQREGRA